MHVPDLWILRHGETEWNREHRLQGWLDSPLTQTGMMQAEAQGRILATTDLPDDVVMITSSSGRAMKTADIANVELGLSRQADDALREVNVGAWQGQTLTQLKQEYPELPIDEDPHLWKFGAPGGETLSEMCQRVDGFLRKLDRPTVLVTHGLTSRLLRARILGVPPKALSSVPGGQGVVHYVSEGQARLLDY